MGCFCDHIVDPKATYKDAVLTVMGSEFSPSHTAQPDAVGLEFCFVGGAFRAVAYAGFLSELKAWGHVPQLVMGNSGGALAAALWATDQLNAMPKILMEMQKATKRHLAIRLIGLKSEHPFPPLLREVFGDQSVEFFRPSLRVWAFDVEAENIGELRNCSLAQSVAASCSLPGVFAPVEINGKKWTDRPIMAPVPWPAAERLGQLPRRVTFLTARAKRQHSARRRRYVFERIFRLSAFLDETVIARDSHHMSGGELVEIITGSRAFDGGAMDVAWAAGTEYAKAFAVRRFHQNVG